jgi:hypothetical protein
MPGRPRNLLIKIQRQDRGSEPHYIYSFVIAGKNLKLKSSANGTVYRLCDVVQHLPQTIDCHGIERPVTIVLKIYARVPQIDLKKQRDNRRYQALLKGTMILNND